MIVYLHNGCIFHCLNEFFKRTISLCSSKLLIFAVRPSLDERSSCTLYCLLTILYLQLVLYYIKTKIHRHIQIAEQIFQLYNRIAVYIILMKRNYFKVYFRINNRIALRVQIRSRKNKVIFSLVCIIRFC